MTDADLRIILAPHASPQWPVERMIRLYRMVHAGDKAPEIAARLDVARNAIHGKISRLIAVGVLPGRTPADPAIQPSRGAAAHRIRALPPAAHNLPLLPSQREAEHD